MRLKTTTPILKFDNDHGELRDSLSAALFVGDHLWLASDESTSVEQLTSDDGLTFKHHRSFPLEDLIDLPALGTEFDQEIDIEGLDYHDSYLWIVGSHSVKRKNVKKEDSGSIEKKIKKLTKTEKDGNRFILARIPLITSATGDQELNVSAKDPGDSERVLNAAKLDGDTNSNDLIKEIREAEDGRGDAHLAKFLSIPGKDNGFDIEGLAVAGDRVYIGLRGPVLRGFAVLLEVLVEFDKPSRLILRENGGNKARYKKHFLDLDGLGFRDVCVDGTDLLILAGPTMNLDGPVAVYRWADAVNSTAKGERFALSDELTRLFLVPHGNGTDHAEGMALIPSSENRKQILVVYDSPGEERKTSAGAVRADVMDLPST